MNLIRILWSLIPQLGYVEKDLMCMCTRIKTFFTENYSFFSSRRHHAHSTNASTFNRLHPLDHRKKKEYKSLKRRETKNTTLIASGKLMCINHSKRLHESSQWIMYIEHIAFILETYESISFLPDQKWTLNLATKAIFRSKVLCISQLN